jgi:hypothetical protein
VDPRAGRRTSTRASRNYFALTRVLNHLQVKKVVGIIRFAAYKVLIVRNNAGETKKMVLAVFIEITKD